MGLPGACTAGRVNGVAAAATLSPTARQARWCHAPATNRLSDWLWQMYAPRAAAMSISVRCFTSHTVLRGILERGVVCRRVFCIEDLECAHRLLRTGCDAHCCGHKVDVDRRLRHRAHMNRV